MRVLVPVLCQRVVECRADIFFDPASENHCSKGKSAVYRDLIFSHLQLSFDRDALGRQSEVQRIALPIFLGNGHLIAVPFFQLFGKQPESFESLLLAETVRNDDL